MKSLSLILALVTLFLLPKIDLAQTPDLGAAAEFTLFTTTGAVSNTGVSEIIGKIGTNNGSITNFTPVPDQQENANSITAQAAIDLQTAYDAMHVSAQTFPSHAAVLGNGETLIPGIYLIPEAASIVGNLILDAQGDQNAIFIIKINGAFAPGPSSQISLTGGALACNVFWAVEGGEVAIATSSSMKGTFIANPGAVSMAASSQLEGRLLSTTGAVAVDGVTAALPSCILLPVTLVSFTAAKENAGIKLSWLVGNEVSLKGYDLERSADGQTFYKIGSVNAADNTAVKTYKWIDGSPIPGKNFYRLRMADLDNSYKYSPVVTIDLNSAKGISVYPNPVVNNTIFVQMVGQMKGEHTISIYNSNSKKVMTDKMTQGDNVSVKSISLYKYLLKGIYFLQVIDPQGAIQTLKIFLTN